MARNWLRLACAATTQNRVVAALLQLQSLYWTHLTSEKIRAATTQGGEAPPRPLLVPGARNEAMNRESRAAQRNPFLEKHPCTSPQGRLGSKRHPRRPRRQVHLGSAGSAGYTSKPPAPMAVAPTEPYPTPPRDRSL